MKKLLVLYDKNRIDSGRDSYLKAIKKHIPSAIIKDIVEKRDLDSFDKLLLLRPIGHNFEAIFKYFMFTHPSYDIESEEANGITITAEAILNVIGDVYGKTVVINNQSELLGVSLAKVLINKGANVISLNSKYEKANLENLLALTDVDILISATGDPKFKLDRAVTRKIDFKIDLSNDLEDPLTLKSIPTVKVLKERLENE